MIYIFALAILQLALTSLLLLHSMQGGTSILWISLLLTTCVSVVVIFACMPTVYRSLLWRRRKSQRPSVELKAERRRIAAAIHDEIASQLFCAISLVRENGDSDLLNILEQCMLDMHTIVDGMDDDSENLVACMAKFRHRLQPVLNRRGIKLNWKIFDEDRFDMGYFFKIKGEKSRIFMAVLKEAVANALRHANATELWITLQPYSAASLKSKKMAELSVEDNGVGVSNGLLSKEFIASCGAGIRNMKRHAKEIDGELLIVGRQGGGVTVRLYCPL